MRHLWWVGLMAAVALIISGIVLITVENERTAFETRGWELATEQRNLPQRPQHLAGINVDLTQYDTAQLTTELDAIAALGFTWVRQPFYWFELQPSSDAFAWAAYDIIVDTIANYPQLELIAVLDGSPPWARDELAPGHPFAPPASAAQYADFAAAVATRYADRIDHYQLWDEPNLRSHWGNTDPQPAIYTAMVRAAYPAIHNADNDAQVILAALAPTVEQGPENYNDISYLNAIYTHGGQDYFDAAAAKPYGYNVGPYDRTVDNGTFNFSRVILMREAMVAQGDADKPIWGSNFGWNALPDDWQGPPSIWGEVSATEQIQFTRDAFARARDEWPWMAGLILQHWQPDAPTDDPVQGFAVAPDIERWHDVVSNIDALTPGFYSVQNPYTTFEGEWQFGPLGADALAVNADDPTGQRLENRATLTFHGTSLAFLVRRYDVITGHFIVQINGQNANTLPENRQGESHIVLKAERGGEALDLITVGNGLENTTHTATLIHRPRQGDDAWALAGIAVATEPDITPNERLGWLAIGLIVVGALLGGVSAWRAPWRTLKLPSQRTLHNAFDASLTLMLSAIFVVGSALTWGDSFAALLKRDPPAILLTLATVGVAFVSPIAILSVLALLAFAIVVFNRPMMGVVATLFWALFFSSNIDAYIRLIAAVEAMLIISVAAIVGRGLHEWAKTQRDRKPNLLRIALQVNDVAQKLHTLDIGMALLVGLALASLSWADLQAEALHELRVMVLGPALFYVLLRTVPVGKQDLLLVVDTIIVGSTIIALLGLFNFLTGDAVTTTTGARRLVAVYGSPNAVALQLGRALPFAIAYVLLPLSLWRRLWGGVTGAVMLVAYLLTQSLGGILIGAPVAAIVFLLLWQGQRAWRLVLGFAALGGVALLPLSQLVPRLQNLTDPDSGSTLFRLNVWRSTVELLEDHPLTGVGLDQFLYAYRSRYIMPEGAADPDLSHPHNIIFEHWVRFGILGVFAFAFIQLMFWRTALRLYSAIQQHPYLLAIYLGTTGAMAYVLAHGLVDASLVFINLSYMFSAIVAILLLLKRIASADTTAR